MLLPETVHQYEIQKRNALCSWDWLLIFDLNMSSDYMLFIAHTIQILGIPQQ
jgi:hypothetical protein